MTRNKHKQMDYHKSSPVEIHDRIQELCQRADWHDIELEMDYLHLCSRHTNDPAQYKRKLNTHDILDRVNQSYPGTFAQYVIQTGADLCRACGTTLSGEVCACGVMMGAASCRPCLLREAGV